jgi:hypothetical protein
LLSVPQDDYWNRHYDFDQPTQKPMVALGNSRIDEILVNTVVPVSLLYARIFKDADVREHTLAFYESFPPIQENSVTRLMQRQLLRGKLSLVGAGQQQGIIQLYKYYCSDGRCAECEVGNAVGMAD